MSNEDRFTDNEDGTLTDTKFNLMWMREDSFLHREKWCTWKGAHKYVEWLNEQNFAGHSDWRVPKSQDCRNLYDHECKNNDHNGDIVHIDYKFPEGCGSNYWCSEENGINAMTYNFYSDRGYLVRKSAKDEAQMSCRAVRGSSAGKKKMGRVSATGRSRRE